MSQLNYNHLRYFWAVAHEGGLARAAERLNVAPSALSVQLQKLERQVGHPLFDRVGKRLRLTEAGRVALDYADTVFRTGDELLNTLRGRPDLDRKVLRVGAIPTLSRNFQLEFLRPLVGRDDVELVVRSGSTRDLLQDLQAQVIDVVLANSPAPRDARSALRSRLLDEEPVAIVGRPSHAPFRFPDDLDGAPMLLPSLDSELRVAFDRLTDLAGVRPVIMAEVDDMAMLRLLARERQAFALVPPIVVRDELRAGVLAELHRVEGLAERFYAILQERRFPNPLVELLLPSAQVG
ncbi:MULTISPECIES: LysR family transcriptional regulator [Caulobacter]|jgi:LysR family transcriptional activator of nhaA|uniref:Transcriptional regulator, LysR family n=1 Tax=Caulobacter vibrioides OR37 TaxID=1292034 RepID=R0CXB6_CAUVI|nr:MULTISPECIES: LysR family transcriptional regulator [Caulobacter]ENZ80975.1 transcriptional regulator, LysR family [Caulobacter vibrioides OR37]MBQ1559358.1 LysR family transcriptional regulator [Caulobacter sp.]